MKKFKVTMQYVSYRESIVEAEFLEDAWEENSVLIGEEVTTDEWPEYITKVEEID